MSNSRNLADLKPSAGGLLPSSKMAAGSAVANIGYTPTNKAGDTMTGALTATGLTGPLTGNASTATNVAYSGLTGTVPTWNQNTTGNAATATNVAYSGLTGTVPTWNQNTTGTASNVTGTVAIANGGIGATSFDAASIPTFTSTSTFTNKTIEAGVFTNGYTEEVATANTSTAYTIDLAGGSVQVLTLTGSCTFTFPTATAGKGFIILLKQDATGSRTVTWPAAVKWPGGTAPTITATASKLDKYVFTADGTNWYGSDAGKNYTV
jgi:hypothetical protein